MKKTIPIEIQLKKEDLKEAGSIVRKANASTAKTWIVRIAWIIVMLFCLWTIFSGNADFGVPALTFFITVVVFRILSLVIVHRQRNKIWRENKAWHAPMHFEFSQANIHLETTLQKSDYAWDSIDKIIETEGYFLLVHPNVSFLILPKRDFSKEIPELRELFKSIPIKFYTTL